MRRETFIKVNCLIRKNRVDSVLSIRLQASVQKWDAAVTSVLKAVKPRKLKCGISLVVYVKVKAIMFEMKVLESTCHLNLEVSEI